MSRRRYRQNIETMKAELDYWPCGEASYLEFSHHVTLNVLSPLRWNLFAFHLVYLVIIADGLRKYLEVGIQRNLSFEVQFPTNLDLVTQNCLFSTPFSHVLARPRNDPVARVSRETSRVNWTNCRDNRAAARCNVSSSGLGLRKWQ